MKELLTEIFKNAVLFDYNDEITDVQRQIAWIGNEPADEKTIAEVEQKLDVQFPTEYKELLKVANGFPTWCDAADPSFMKVEEIGYLRDIDPQIVEKWSGKGNEDIGATLSKSILVGGYQEEQYFLLIPPAEQGAKWKYWKFASWIPGEIEFDSLTFYLENMLEFMQESLEEEEY
ncbi:SMI1/KNR4 family protein [Chondrinema litorale]|uniref:SMI1/KNR4 family protein n=1 Tax=Chondrinema litorale TaxID=2994555 RepID=UPI0025435362|nr:SMI1/KNR4 family protein [Chondrinema litorale]UZR99539.1 SMI1/KNR4 family protein [Chondrinema litorale]